MTHEFHRDVGEAGAGVGGGGSIMNQRLWSKAAQQAANIPLLKTAQAKRSQIVLLCETLKKALRGGK